MPHFARVPGFRLLYNGSNISADVSKFLTHITYKDFDQGESDEIEIGLEDVDGLWRGSWYPEKGATLQLSLGYFEDNADKLVDFGAFDLEEITVSGPPDTVTLRALAAGITKAVRTKRSKSFEGQSLRQIASYIATKNKLTLSGSIPDVYFDRRTQYREKDLSFLARISKEYGCLFSLRGSQLVFTNVLNIENGQAVVNIDRGDIAKYMLKDRTGNTYKGANVKYHNPGDKTIKTAKVTTLENKDNVTYKQISTEDTLEIRSKAESPAQADLKAKAALHATNSMQQEGTLDFEGLVFALAGNSINVTGLGILSGKYYVRQSSHTLTREGGYRTGVDIKRINEATPAGQISQKKVSSQAKPSYQVENKTNKDGVTFVQIVR